MPCRVLVIGLAWSVLGASAPVGSSSNGDELAARLMRRELQRASSSALDREIVQILTEIPPGVESGWHSHPGEEVGYILSGDVEMKVAGRSDVVLRVGDGFVIPARTAHNARDLGPESGRMLSTYFVERGQPLSKAVAPPGPR